MFSPIWAPPAPSAAPLGRPPAGFSTGPWDSPGARHAAARRSLGHQWIFSPLTLVLCDSGRDNQLRVKSPPMIVIINFKTQTKQTNKQNKTQWMVIIVDGYSYNMG